jgi:hypothetical protein
MVYTMTSPWTLEGRYTAIQKAVAEVYERYFSKGPRWVAKHLPQRAQMQEYGSKVSPESREILLGDFGVESYIEDYAVHAIGASGDSSTTRQIYTQWVFDENRHSKALWYCLVDSGLYTHREMDDYAYEAGQDVWTFERQTGCEATPERGAAYAIAQERQTKRNYQSMQKRIWEEYGSPAGADGKPMYPAIAGVCQALATDEGFHEAVFRKITRVYLQFWPDKALQAMWDVYEKYRMPMVKLQRRGLLDAVLPPHRFRSLGHQDVLEPTYTGLGLESRAAPPRGGRAGPPEGSVIQIDGELPEDRPTAPCRTSCSRTDHWSRPDP